MTDKYHKLCNTCPFGTIKLDSLQRNLNQLQEQVKELEATVGEWESGALVRGWREIRDTGIKAMGDRDEHGIIENPPS